MSWQNRKMARSIAQARAGKNYLIVVNIPDIRQIEKYMRTGEAVAIMRTTTRWLPEQDRLLKGFVDVYNAKDMPKIKFDTDKGVVWPSPSFSDTFENIKTIRPELWNSYLNWSTLHKSSNRKKSLEEWDKPKLDLNQIKKDMEIDAFIRRRIASKRSYEQIKRDVMSRFGRSIGSSKITYVKRTI